MNKLLYDGFQPIASNKQVVNKFLRFANMTYISRLIHNIIFNIVMPIIGLRDYVSNKDKFYIYNVIVEKKVNLREVIFYYWLQAFKDRFNQKKNRKLVPYYMLFSQIMRDVRVDVFGFARSEDSTQLIRSSFAKVGITNNFSNWEKC